MNKVILFLVSVFVAGSMVAQTAKKSVTGNDDFDKAYREIMLSARKDLNTFKVKMIGKFNLTEEKMNEYSAKYNGADLFMIMEVNKKANISLETVMAEFDKNRGYKTWAEMLSDLGVKKDSEDYAAIKNAVINNGIL